MKKYRITVLATNEDGYRLVYVGNDAEIHETYVVWRTDHGHLRVLYIGKSPVLVEELD